MVSLKTIDKTSEDNHLCVLYNELKEFGGILRNEEEKSYVRIQLDAQKEIIVVNQYSRILFLVKKPAEENIPRKAEKLRKLGLSIQKLTQEYKIKHLQLENNTPSSANILDFLEGLVLSSYQFLNYKTDKKSNELESIAVCDFSLTKTELSELKHICEGVYIARNLVNEPLSYLTAEKLSEEIEKTGKEAGFEVEVLSKSKIKSLKMGGLLGVNYGSTNPPTFNILEYKPKNAINKLPIVLVGKGVVYDTGGYSLKPADSLDWMKCDMAGAAAVIGAFHALAKNKLPLYIVGLIPATENKLAADSLVPGDVIEMYNGKTVEVVNTDAEGRLILADALAFASKYKPLIAIDLATLTGSAMRAIGKEGIVYMGTAPEEIKLEFEKSGNMVHERLVEFPLWEEYDEQLKSDIADYKNLGDGAEAGAIMGGKFLQQFTDYPWLHLDIAGVAYMKSHDSYRGKNGTGVGVRLLYKYLKGLALK
jgi:leucyl aminopeptidase